MGDLQIRVLDHLISSQYQIQIDGARSALVRPRPAGVALDAPQGFVDFAGGSIRLPHSHGIEIRRIVLEAGTDGRRFDDGGEAEIGERCRDALGRGGDVAMSVAEI